MMVIVLSVHDSMYSLLRSHAIAVILGILFFEELGVPSPIPGDLMMVFAGIRVAQGQVPLWFVLFLQELVTVVGASGLFFLSRRCGRPLVLRFGKFIHLGPESLARAEKKINDHGGWAIVIGRILPGLRIATPIAAGVLGMPFTSFLPALALGAFIYIASFTMIGVVVGPAALAFYDRVALPTNAVISLIVLAVLAFAMRQIRRSPPAFTQDRYGAVTSSLFAGLLAGVAALMATNSMLDLFSFVRRLFGREPLIAARGVGSGLRFLIAWPAFLIFAALLGLLAYVLGVTRLPRWMTILVSAGVPLFLSLAILYPLTEQRHVGLTEFRERIIFATDSLRWIIYGIALATFLPLLPHFHRVTPATPPIPSRHHPASALPTTPED